MTNRNQIFEQLNSIASNDLFKKPATALLNDIKQYLQTEVKNIEAKFSKSEYKFYKSINYYISNKTGGLKKYLPFLVSDAEKTNTELLKEISALFDKKTSAIKSFYGKDILIVDEFLTYTKQKLKTGELFFYEPDYKDALWTKKEFPRNMFSYLAYQIRTNPNSLTTNYIEDMKGYFSFIGLSMNDEEKTIKANHYFSKTKDPFSFNIPERYNDVRSEIQMAVVVMSQNEKLLGQIANDVIEKYAD